ncbi:hypothetical protein ACWCQW_47390 [Streptomyces mirabilis]
MPRSYTMTQAARDARAKGGRATLNSPDGLITRIERAKARLTPEHIARLSALLASATSTTDADS